MRTKLTRRELLRLAAALGALPALTFIGACGDGDSGSLPEYEFDGEPGPEDLFQHAVASGDPLPDAVILWTRVSPATPGSVPVFWEVARDAEFANRIGAGWVDTDASRDYTVKLDAVGLRPGTTYYYRFRSLGRTSPLGRTRTAAARGEDGVRFGVVSCSRYPDGLFHAYRRLAERDDLDAVLHLGDYIYEDGAQGPVRPHDPPHELLALEDYRGRYAQYRRDPDLQAAHRNHPFITVWDDHESTNNSWRDGADNHEEDEGPWIERRARAEQVYSEWMPIRDQSDGRIFRALRFGDLVELFMLDTRLWGRAQQALQTNDFEVIHDPNRSLLGFDQEEWLAEQLAGSSARWTFLGQQVILGQWKLAGAPNAQGGGVIANTDGWDGYAPSRERLFQAVRASSVRNLVVVTGDVHSSWAMDLNEDPNEPTSYDPETGAGSLGVELVTPGVCSRFVIDDPGFLRVFLGANPHLKYGNISNRGYVVVEVTSEEMRASWFHFDQVEEPGAIETLSATFVTRDGENHLVAAV